MNLLDIFEGREPHQQAIDKLEQARIDHLKQKMDYYAKHRMVKDFQKAKAEHDSYFKVQDECMGYGTLVGEAGIGQDIVNKQEKMARATPPTPAGKVASTVKNVAKWLAGKGGPGKEGPTYENKVNEEEDEAQAQQELGAGFGVYQALLNAWNEKKPYAKVPMPGGEFLTISRAHIFNVLYALKQMNDNTFKKTIANAFSNLDKFMLWSNSIKRYQLPKEKPAPAPTAIMPGGEVGVQGSLAIKEAGQKKNSEKEVDPQSPEVQRYLTKVRRQSPNATSDLEAIAKNDLDKQARVNKNIDDLEQVNARQDAALKRAMTLDRQQGNELDDVEQQVNQLAQRVQSIKAAKPVAGQATSSDSQTKSATPAVEPTSTAYIVEPEKLPQKDQEIYSQVKNLETELKQKFSSIADWEKAAKTDDKSRNELEALRKDFDRTKNEIDQKIEKLEKSGAQVKRAKPAKQQDKTTQKTNAPQQDKEPKPKELPPVSTKRKKSSVSPVRPELGQEQLPVGTTAGTKQSRNYISGLRKKLGQTVGDYDLSSIPTAPEDDVQNIIGPEEFAQMGSLERQPTTVEESAMSELDAMRQDLENMNERQFYAAYGISKVAFQQKYRTLLKPALDEDQRLHVGDPIIVTAPNKFEGKTGEIAEFSPSGKFVVVNLYNYGEHSMHLSDVEYNQYADDEDEVDEGWSDAIVAQRTGQPRTPYSVYIKGKKWRDFENEDHAENVANKLRAKFKQEGKDSSVITIAPTDYDKDIKEDAGSWIVYDPKTKAIKKRFKTHTAGKSYAKTHGLGFASSEYYFDTVKQQVSEESSTGSEAVERAIIHRIMVDDKLRNMAMDIGTDKVFQAVEEVAYNVGDVDEIGTSDVSAYVAQVKQILGVPEELDEKWSQKYKSSINCAHPKGFSQKAHCAGRKK